MVWDFRRGDSAPTLIVPGRQSFAAKVRCHHPLRTGCSGCGTGLASGEGVATRSGSRVADDLPDKDQTGADSAFGRTGTGAPPPFGARCESATPVASGSRGPASPASTLLFW